jgi:hypothetical protein
MRLHPRLSIVREAELEIETAISEIAKKHKLTYGEIFSILSTQIQREAKYMIRAERHPGDPDKKGDEA